MKKMMTYILIGNFFSIINVLCVLEESYTTGLIVGFIACAFYLKALTIKMR